MKEELNKTIDELNEVIKEKQLQILDKDLLDLAIKLYITDSINKQKQFYPDKEFNKFLNGQGKQITNELNNEKKIEQPTDKQIKACKKLNLIIPEGSSKQDVWKLMKENKERQ
jgi:hypothetical protein